MVNESSASFTGNFVITWYDDRNGDYDIYIQRYDSGGVAHDSNEKVNDDVGINGQWLPSIAMTPDGTKFIIFWTDIRNSDKDWGNWGKN